MSLADDSFKSLVAGGIAGFSVDVVLFPLDTIKTRAQSAEGFLKAGGFKNIYNGLAPAAAGSVPTASLFFFTYETTKGALTTRSNLDPTLVHMASGACGEIAACLLRVPTENVKQNLQTPRYATAADAVRGIVQTRGGVSGLYTGYFTTVMREVPFAVIQFPLWEGAKKRVAKFRNAKECSPVESAACGSVSGAFAAAVTTPLDVVKTRLMTSPEIYNKGPVQAFRTIRAAEGNAALFKGVQPRVLWIGVGGFVFFGAYESAKKAVGGFLDE